MAQKMDCGAGLLGFQVRSPLPTPPFPGQTLPPPSGPVGRPHARIRFCPLFVPRLRRLSNSQRLSKGGGAALFSHQSLLRERGDPVSSQGNLPRECGLGKEPFFSTVLTRVEQSVAPSPNLPPPPSLSPAFPFSRDPLVLLNSSLRLTS